MKRYALAIVLAVLLILLLAVPTGAQFSSGGGQFGSPFFRHNLATNTLEFLGPAGVVQLRMRDGYIIVPSCPLDTSTVEFGTICKNVDTNVLVYCDGGGCWAL